MAAKNPLVQNTTVRAAVVLMPRVSTATLLSAVARSSRPSRVARSEFDGDDRDDGDGETNQ